ncbi:MAG TPA: DNA-processing protein DprA, partial [Abditibacteriaceae bacterium]
MTTTLSDASTPSASSREAWLRLAFVGLPAERCNAALERFGTPRDLLDAAVAGHDAELLSTRGITPTTVERLREAAARDLTRAYAAMETHGIRMLLTEDDDYPVALRGIPSPPPYLFIRGDVQERDEVAVAIVGTRGATEYGRGVAEKLAIELAARGVTVVSGLARGIDTAAHRGALDAGGRTFAVCGCGLDIVYPSDNKKLMVDVQNGGAAFSEFAPTVHPESWHFPARNRIISGLSAGVIVVEAGERSGALITADFAMEQGRDVFAVPGNIHRVQSRGTHALIKQGATLVESADDVIGALNNRALPFERSAPAAKSTTEKRKSAGRTFGATPQRALPSLPRADLSPTENRVYLALEVEARHVDDIATAAQMGAAEANSTLVLLELKGIARRL